MKRLLLLFFLATNTNSFANSYQDCHLRLCDDFDQYLTYNKVNDEMHIDVTILKLVEINKEEKQIIYKHKFQNLIDINVLIEVLLKPYFSSITNVLYKENGIFRRSLMKNKIPKNSRPEKI